MSQGCLRCLKYTMCVANFLCFLCGTAVLGLGAYMMMIGGMSALFPSMASTINVSTLLLICGTIITCVSFLGFLGALKENRCLLLTFFLLLFILMLAELTAACILLMKEEKRDDWLEKDLKEGLKTIKAHGKNSSQELEAWNWMQKTFDCCGVSNVSDWGADVPESCCVETPCDKPKQYRKEGCLPKMRAWFEENFLFIGISVIVLCIIEVLGMCFAMTLFCHISRSGLGYKL